MRQTQMLKLIGEQKTSFLPNLKGAETKWFYPQPLALFREICLHVHLLRTALPGKATSHPKTQPSDRAYNPTMNSSSFSHSKQSTSTDPKAEASPANRERRASSEFRCARRHRSW
uniref:Uncharacterized protein n=1 Tax=Lotharella oceanica TaxID=641309 RepID=A0A7S2TRV4_9EUKA